MKSSLSEGPEVPRIGPADLTALSIVPWPERVEPSEAGCVLPGDGGLAIVSDAQCAREAQYLADVLAPAFGARPVVAPPQDGPPAAPPGARSVIALRVAPPAAEGNPGAEGYRLDVAASGVTIVGGDPAGVFYGIQTLRQLLPAEVFSEKPVSGVPWVVPGVRIQDRPRFAWRGHLFDCCRHFFSKDTVKRSIDLLALHKMNRLHWHLTEDQGWRLEIRQFPKLTEVGAWRIEKNGERYGGYYTQEDVREIVEYAAARHIVVVPEIEMPGHSLAAISSYPQWGCTGGPYEVANFWGVIEDVYCAGNDETIQALKEILDEVMVMFPSPWIHIGGDECPKNRWKACPKCQARIRNEGLANEDELQSWFVHQMDEYLTSKGRRLIGWDEILEGGLAPGAVVQSWRGIKGGIAAARDKHDVIMSPTSHCYLDYSHDTTSVEKSYSFEPVPEELNADEARHILGLEGNLWTEWVRDQNRLDYQVYPRLAALSEVAWSPKQARNWQAFSPRLENHLTRLDQLGVQYWKPGRDGIPTQTILAGQWLPEQMSLQGADITWDVTSHITQAGTWLALFYYTTGNAAIQIEWVALLEDGQEIARDTHTGWSGYDKRDIMYRLPLAQHKPASRYEIRMRAATVGGTESTGDFRLARETKTE